MPEGVHYASNGSGRDHYILHNNGGFDAPGSYRLPSRSAHEPGFVVSRKLTLEPLKKSVYQRAGAYSTTSGSTYSWPKQTANNKIYDLSSGRFDLSSSLITVYPSGLLHTNRADAVVPSAPSTARAASARPTRQFSTRPVNDIFSRSAPIEVQLQAIHAARLEKQVEFMRTTQLPLPLIQQPVTARTVSARSFARTQRALLVREQQSF